MKNKTLFEELGVQYQEVDGNYYPLLSVDTEAKQVTNLGKCGRLWIEFIIDTNFQRYQSLVRFGKLHDRADEVNEEAYELLEAIENGWLKKNKLKDPNSFMEQLHIRNQARYIAEEIVLQEIVRQFH